MRKHVAVIQGLVVVAAALLASETFAAEGSKGSNPCPEIGILPSRDQTQLPLSVGGIPFQKKVISPAGALISEQATPTLLGPASGTTPINVTEIATERPGWVLLKPNDGPLVVGTYTAQTDVACTDGRTEHKTASVKVVPDAPLPTTIGTVRLGSSFVGGELKKSFDATTVFITPSKELEPYLDIVAWRVTAISPEGKPHTSLWIDYGGQARLTGQTELQLSASAFCPAKGPQKIEVEAAIPGQATIKTAGPSWDVGELVCNDPANGGGGNGQPPGGNGTTQGGSNGEGCSITRPSSTAGSGLAFLSALAIAGVRRRRRWRA